MQHKLSTEDSGQYKSKHNNSRRPICKGDGTGIKQKGTQQIITEYWEYTKTGFIFVIQGKTGRKEGNKKNK